MYTLSLNPKDLLPLLVKFSISLAIVGLLFRFIFKLFGGTSELPIPNFIYQSTDPLLMATRAIFGAPIENTGAVFEFHTIITIILYVLAGWLVIKLIEYIHNRTSNK